MSSNELVRAVEIVLIKVQFVTYYYYLIKHDRYMQLLFKKMKYLENLHDVNHICNIIMDYVKTFLVVVEKNSFDEFDIEFLDRFEFNVEGDIGCLRYFKIID